MKLLGSPGSPYARKARIAMLEKNVTCEFVPARAGDASAAASDVTRSTRTR